MWAIPLFVVIAALAHKAGLISRVFFCQFLTMVVAARFMPSPRGAMAALIWVMLMLVFGIIAGLLAERRS